MPILAVINIFRSFKSTLEPPKSIIYAKIMFGHFGLPLDFFGQILTQGTLRHILGPVLVIFEICHFLMIPGPFEYFLEKGCPQSFLDEGAIITLLSV